MNDLNQKSILGLVFLDLCLALALFLSAGSFGFWQAWVFLVVWTICVVLITLYLMRYDRKLLASRVQAGPAAETQRLQQVIQGFASLFFIGIFVVAGLDDRFHWSAVPPFLSEIANIIVVLGFFVVFLVFRTNSYTSAVIEVSEEQKVISTGPYSIVRHPMYSGAVLLLLFAPLTLGSWVAVLFVLPLILVLVIRLVAEEKYLITNLRGYEAYLQKVRYRLIPFIW